LPVEQLATRITKLEEKKTENAPGKRTAHRRAARLTRFYTGKGGKLPIVPAAPPVAPAPAPAATPAVATTTGAKPDAKKTEAKKGSGK